jgi:hypothetical protein
MIKLVMLIDINLKWFIIFNFIINRLIGMINDIFSCFFIFTKTSITINDGVKSGIMNLYTKLF